MKILDNRQVIIEFSNQLNILELHYGAGQCGSSEERCATNEIQ